MDEIEGPHRNVATNGAVRKGSAPKKPVGEPSVYSAARMGIYHRCMVNPQKWMVSQGPKNDQFSDSIPSGNLTQLLKITIYSGFTH
jgi:hypothetical protein